ncbi:hypothetical protein IEQ34_023493 [Dendrobium chrysotoxum]|uniref:50S ribosomal protein L34 n=1 Tax=Dendrobium chrysotoxum TaxID=161865 RepID=A0AAV7FSQ4_DENCH|nr:hypothetical protein IEQ34_025910 [Dendrobium chrysotoxum]KAH0440357.1 hypothetical protein IEQ34_025599 [Dendrobium chrysotoxum]KAH0440529.1 hypothetical protein IEQ34_025552 [Dendrobium chrysotoxum]KAH0440560.1 hypothetical protein IEQ34_025583 [Dendrobium chrysotoxum]KAH0446133.1 hypothetical protein IEQ34_025035 [Dendrobium chrysotoxum]
MPAALFHSQARKLLASARSTLREPDKKGVVEIRQVNPKCRRSSTVVRRKARSGFRARTRKRQMIGLLRYVR